jgi:hypothetical protein
LPIRAGCALGIGLSQTDRQVMVNHAKRAPARRCQWSAFLSLNFSSAIAVTNSFQISGKAVRKDRLVGPQVATKLDESPAKTTGSTAESLTGEDARAARS